MGGKKKLTLKQIEKMQARKSGVQQREGKLETLITERKTGIFPPNPKDEKVINEVKKMKVLTPYTIASKFNLRLSVAKDFLEELERRGIIEFVSGSRNIKIYKPIR